MSSTSFSSPFNSTATLETLIIPLTNTTGEPANVYDHVGAAIYIAVILVWYSTGLAMMLFLQVRPRTLQQQFLYDSSNPSTKNRIQSLTANPFAGYRNIQADNTTKQILNELKDPEKRQRLWKIYYASSEKQNEPYPQYYQTITTDGATIDRIKRKLANIHRMDTQNDNDLTSSSVAVPTNDNRSSSPFDSSKFFAKRFPSLRRPAATGGTSTNTRPPFIRAQSQVDTSSARNAVENEPLVSGRQFLMPPNNNSRKRTNLFSNRFVVEKVPDNNTIPATVKENSME